MCPALMLGAWVIVDISISDSPVAAGSEAAGEEDPELSAESRLSVYVHNIDSNNCNPRARARAKSGMYYFVCVR